jgi:hypothetical protein
MVHPARCGAAQLFDKAAAMQTLFKDLAVLTTCGAGFRIMLPRTCGGGERRLPRRTELTTVDLLTLMEEGVPCRPAADATSEWRERQARGERELGTLPRMCNNPFAVMGYTMMIRGESFRSDRRVPTHMLNHMSGAMSIDRIVQSAGRATFQGADFLQRNGFDGVSVLMLKFDYDTVRAYMRLMDEIKRRILVEGHTVVQCFSANTEPYPEDLYVLVDPAQKRRIGNLREGHELDIPVAGGEARAAAAEAEAERVEREKKKKEEDAAAARAVAKAAKKLEKKRERDSGAGEGDAQGMPQKKSRAYKTLDSVRAWAAEAHATLQAGGTLAAVKASKMKLRVLRCGVLRPEPAFRRVANGRRGAPLSALLPVGYRALCEREGVTFIQEVRLAATPASAVGASDEAAPPAPEFAVWRAAFDDDAGADAPAHAWVSDSPAGAWELALQQLAAEVAAAGGAAGASAIPSPVAAAAPLAGNQTPPSAARGGSISALTALANFGLNSHYVRALLELQPGLGACCVAPGAYAVLQESDLAVPAALRPADNGGTPATGGAAGGMDTPASGLTPYGTPVGSPRRDDDGAGGDVRMDEECADDVMRGFHTPL